MYLNLTKTLWELRQDIGASTMRLKQVAQKHTLHRKQTTESTIRLFVSSIITDASKEKSRTVLRLVDPSFQLSMSTYHRVPISTTEHTRYDQHSRRFSRIVQTYGPTNTGVCSTRRQPSWPTNTIL